MAQKIMIIRHAEKPSDDNSIKGVTVVGDECPEELIVRGWQRSGALVRFFAPVSGGPRDPRLAVPQAIFASAIAHRSKSLRPQHTVLELSTLLVTVPISLDYSKDEGPRLAAALATAEGVSLVAWEHEAIPDIVNGIVGNKTTCPQKWLGDRYDLVWVLDRPSRAGAWTFSQVPQLLLAGDKETPIPF